MIDQFAQLILNGIILGTWIACIAFGFALVFAVCDHFHIAHHGIWLAGGYLVAIVAAGQSVVSVLASVAVSALIFAGLGVLVAKGVYAPLQKNRRIDVFVASLAILTIVQNALALAFGTATRFLDVGPVFLTQPSEQIGPVYIEAFQLCFMAVAIPSLAVAAAWLTFSRRGRLIRAVVSNRDLARTLGIDVSHCTMAAYAVGSALLAPAVIPLLAQTGLGPYAGLQEFVLAIAAAFATAQRRIVSVIAAAYALSIVKEVSLYWVASEWQISVALALFVVVVSLSRTKRAVTA